MSRVPEQLAASVAWRPSSMAAPPPCLSLCTGGTQGNHVQTPRMDGGCLSGRREGFPSGLLCCPILHSSVAQLYNWGIIFYDNECLRLMQAN